MVGRITSSSTLATVRNWNGGESSSSGGQTLRRYGQGLALRALTVLMRESALTALRALKVLTALRALKVLTALRALMVLTALRALMVLTAL
jgi:hypothetical protein